jgi:2-amino-4-hydroxy-6-hydroxymethyldihydropteridine diphosphokinase
MSVTAYIALGSNLGDRQANLEEAVGRLAAARGVTVVRRSATYETAPVGGPAGQGPYLNAAIEVTTSLSPSQLLALCQAIEAGLGRVRGDKDGPRTIDLDILLYGEQRVAEPRLTIPHPRLHERLFVLEPLAEIAPGLAHPMLGLTIAELRRQLLGVCPAGRSPGRELTGLRALVTGSTSGIGRAIALELAAGGAGVITHGRRSLQTVNEVADAVQRLAGAESAALLADLRDLSACDLLAENAWRTWGGLDVLVNNAGADTLTGEAARHSFDEKLDALLAVDVKATIRLSRSLGRRMKDAGGGVIINVSWDQAETGMEGDSGELFAAVKGAVMCFSRSLALSLAPQVRVHCVAPGWIRTAWGETASEAWQERVKRETPLGVWGRPEDVAAAVRWLVSPAARYLTGQVVRVNGGAVR